MVAVVIDGLSFCYAATMREPVFSGVSLSIRSGEVTCLVGPSGCGKTTLLNLIAGFLPPTQGSLASQHVTTGRTGYIFQQDALLPWRTVRANLGLASELRGIPAESDEARVAEHLHAFNLDNDVLTRYPNELSGGMRQRIAIIQSLMADPTMLLLDEPFAALDFYTRLRLETEFRALVTTSGMTAVFVTHDIEEAIAVGDRVLVMGRSPRGMVADLGITFDDGERPPPEQVRGHRQFGEYYTAIWRCLRNAI